jgi:hypothetical protein
MVGVSVDRKGGKIFPTLRLSTKPTKGVLGEGADCPLYAFIVPPVSTGNSCGFVSPQAGKSVHGLPRSHKPLTGQPAPAGVGRGHGEEPITRILKIYNSVFSVLFGVSVYQKVKSGWVNTRIL